MLSWLETKQLSAPLSGNTLAITHATPGALPLGVWAVHLLRNRHLCSCVVCLQRRTRRHCLELGQFGVREVSIRALKGACMQLDVQNQQHYMEDTSMRQACLTLLV
jgi:hypothetical protein